MSLPVSIANCYVKFKEPQMAIDILKDGLTSDSANINMLKTIGYLYYLGEDYPMASDNFSKAHEAGDSTDFVYKHLGFSLYYQNRYESAIPYLEEYYHADTLNSEATYYLGLAMSSWYMKTEGISYLEKTITLLTPEPIYIGSILATIGLTYSDMNMNKQAIRSYSKALESDPGRSAYMFEIAKMHDIIGKRESDASEYRKAIEWFKKYLSIEEPRLKTIMETRNLDMEQIDAPGINYARSRIKAINEELFFMGEK